MQLSRKHVVEVECRGEAPQHLRRQAHRLPQRRRRGCRPRARARASVCPIPKRRWYGEPPDRDAREFWHQARADGPRRAHLAAVVREADAAPLATLRREAFGLLEDIRGDPSMAEVLIENAEYLRVRDRARRATRDDREARRLLATALEDLRSSSPSKRSATHPASTRRASSSSATRPGPATTSTSRPRTDPGRARRRSGDGTSRRVRRSTRARRRASEFLDSAAPPKLARGRPCGSSRMRLRPLRSTGRRRRRIKKLGHPPPGARYLTWKRRREGSLTGASAAGAEAGVRSRTIPLFPFPPPSRLPVFL